LGVGDGSNDVSMIQKASIGVGLFGVEGGEASKVSEIAIHRFNQLHRLIFYHGR